MLRELPASDRPRERLHALGPMSLSDVELLAIVLGTGGGGRDVLALAREVLVVLDGSAQAPALSELQSVNGLGSAKSALVSAAMELARRYIAPAKVRIAFPVDVLPLISHFADRKQEYFLAVSLNGAHEVIATRVVSIGLVNRTVVHPREVYADPITDRAAAIVVAHNHPSGCVDPSREDRDVTRRLVSAGQTLGIQLLDHVIFSTAGYYSFLEKGEL